MWIKKSVSNTNWRTYISCLKSWHQTVWNSRPLLEIQPWLQMDRNKILVHELNTTTRKTKDTIHSIKTENCINGISYKLPDIRLPAINVKHDGNTQTKNNPPKFIKQIPLRSAIIKPGINFLMVRIGPNSPHLYDFIRQTICPKWEKFLSKRRQFKEHDSRQDKLLFWEHSTHWIDKSHTEYF